MAKKCGKNFKRVGDVCVRKKQFKEFFRKIKFKKLIDKFVFGLGTTLVLGFSWIAIRGFADLPLFISLTPGWRIFIGTMGAIITVILWQVIFNKKLKR